jgi:lysyl-tRNA synthetase class 2
MTSPRPVSAAVTVEGDPPPNWSRPTPATTTTIATITPNATTTTATPAAATAERFMSIEAGVTSRLPMRAGKVCAIQPHRRRAARSGRVTLGSVLAVEGDTTTDEPERPVEIAYEFPVTDHAAEIAETWAALPVAGRTSERVSVAGRLMLIRCHGGLTFGVLRDRSGPIQLFVDRRAVGDDLYRKFLSFNRGDWVGVTGPLLRTDRGELSIALEEVTLLGRAVRPLPDKDKPLTDVEVRYRQRYLDLMTNERTRQIFEVRRIVIQTIRRHLEDRGFWEVEGPILQSIQGGATARPFITHHNALDIDMYLRIALELHLKRLVVGGMERVFEIGRVFRNEGIDVRHNPEFTMLEAYQAFADYTDMMDLVEGMVVAAAQAALPGTMVV